MQLHLRLFHKTLLLVAVPLLMELIFTASLYLQVQDVEALAVREHKAHEAYASLNSLYERVAEVSKLVGMYVVLHKENLSLDVYQELIATVPQDLENLKTQLQNKPGAIAKVEELERELNKDLRIISDIIALTGQGDRIGAIQRLRQLNSVPHLLELLGAMRGECEQDAYESFEIQQRARDVLANYLRFGISANILVAILLAVIVNRSVVSRLAVVTQNSKRLAQGQPLLPALTGGDEIAHLDKVFNDMATALEMAHRKERAVIDTMPAGLLITDKAGFLQMANPTAAMLCGHDCERLLGRHIASLFVLEDKIDARLFLRQLESKARQRIDERTLITALGKHVPVEVSLTSFTVFDREYFLFILLDITERKEVERWKQEFVSMVSHDLRTPLTSIQVFLNMLCQGMFGQISIAAEKKAATAGRNVTRLIALINDLLDIEKMESGKLDLAVTDISLEQVIERSLESVRDFAEQQKIVIERSGRSRQLVSADGDRLVQVLVNLLGNAVKFSPAQGIVTVAVEDHLLSVKVRVSDQGRGVPVHLQTAIFERFKQVDFRDAREKKGSGLGLAICKAIIEQHGGKIAVDSNGERGSTFWFVLPVAGSDAALQPEIVLPVGQ